MTSDLDLLGQFSRDHSQDAFTALVNRHLNLVYSAALRQVRSSQLAEEIAQSVFVDLARQAGKLDKATGGSPVLTAWLYTVTRRTAIDVVRRESRRRLREQIAVETTNMNATSSDWQQIEPLLDDAMAALDDTDRSAVLLRYFENKSLREVGEALGTSDDAAQKRVSRAVERLREFFTKRGVAVAASGLAVLVAANAVQAAPAGLAATISAAAVLAGTAVSTSTVITATKAIAMTTLQKAMITATVVILAGGGIYEARQATQLRERNQVFQQKQTSLAQQLGQLQQEYADMSNRLVALQAENAQLKSGQNTAELLKLRGELARRQNATNDPADGAAKSWLTRVNQLKQYLDQNPQAKIPELQFVTEDDWLNAARGSLNGDADYRRAMSTLRSAGEHKVGNMLQKALKAYMQANHDQMPTDLAQLQPYFDSPLDDAILQRWEIAPAETVQSLRLGGDVIITQRAPVDEVFDIRWGIGPNGFGSTDFLSTSTDTYKTMQPVFDAYRAAHNGQWQDNLSELQLYATTPEQQAALQKLILKKAAGN
ncbi:MAG TPA: sigma-70 family RNA polymerase sigma factor [Candidatus Acidoferrum sp.]|nr:sigma-70 family RNA polymerase sigma factor [Candidatus Acidoferrum sp.]